MRTKFTWFSRNNMLWAFHKIIKENWRFRRLLPSIVDENFRWTNFPTRFIATNLSRNQQHFSQNEVKWLHMSIWPRECNSFEKVSIIENWDPLSIALSYNVGKITSFQRPGKMTFVVLIYYKGWPEQPSNLRPITLEPVCTKVSSH